MKTQEISRNLGGDRLGSGAKNNIKLHGYKRSTHDLSRAWRSSMNVGTLVPFMKIVGIPGDTFSIDLETLVKTIPTIGPLYGSFKLQLDIFECPIRLYNGLLHNNMCKIGMNMAQVKLPKFSLTHKMNNPLKYAYDINNTQIASDALLNYLGLRGIGDAEWPKINGTNTLLARTFNAVPLLAYWDIYKQYYANKQEEKGAYISVDDVDETTTIYQLGGGRNIAPNDKWNFNAKIEEASVTQYGTLDNRDVQLIIENETGYPTTNMFHFRKANGYIELNGPIELNKVNLLLEKIDDGTKTFEKMGNMYNGFEVQGNRIYFWDLGTTYLDYYIQGINFTAENLGKGVTTIKTFDLANIDEARINILQDTGLGVETNINTWNLLPYTEIVGNNSGNIAYTSFKQMGLALKTYQSDLLQNWLETEWIDGVNGINAITAVDVSSGSFTIDSLNLANKVYNMLNRIAVSGGSYEDYIEAVYTVKANRRAENPIYKGGMSAEIIFDEVVSMSATNEQPLGSMAGRGNVYNKKGGHVEIGMLDEASYIIGIASITPRIDYSQGNDWDMTELDTMDDLHKPQLDGIGFEDLLQERAAWWGTYFDVDEQEWKKLAMGKTPAWINYMTAVNEAHGDFAEVNNTMYMTLNRRYEMPLTDPFGTYVNGVGDLTTYVDPTKYNYAFADTNLEAQNFWVQIGMKIEARRVMSAKIIPNL